MPQSCCFTCVELTCDLRPIISTFESHFKSSAMEMNSEHDPSKKFNAARAIKSQQETSMH